MIELELDSARVVFSTRAGGVSDGPYRSLNLGILTGDDPDRVRENRRLLARRAGVDPAAVAMGRQVHGTQIAEWAAPSQGPLREVDGHLTCTPGLGLLVLAADCLPVALGAPGRVGMVHCGWRGLAGGVLERAVEAFDEPPAAAVGPGIGACCYRVGEEVARHFATVPGALQGQMLDLRAAAEAGLRAAGVGHVQHVDLCTSCRPDLFFSHRRDQGVTGRQCGLAWIPS